MLPFRQRDSFDPPPQMPHTSDARRVDPGRHHHHGEHGNSWPLDRKMLRQFPRDISPAQEAPSTPLATPSPAPSRKRKRCQSPPHDHLSKPTNSEDRPRSPKHRATERKPLADAQNLSTVVQAPLVRNTSNTGLGSPNHNSKMSYPPLHTTQLPPSFIPALQSPAAAAYATATSYRQCVQRFADKHHYAVYIAYHGAGPSHAQSWRAQITLTQKVYTGHEVTVIDHTSSYWYTKQADAKEAASAEVWPTLVGRG